jgi:Family of unknown function (DUF5317)
MILVWVTSIGVWSALFTSTRWRRLSELQLRHLWLVWAALGVQLVLFEYLGQRLPMSVSDKIHLATYALALAFIWLNRRLPGGWLIALGTSFNLTAIVANDGTMPANATAWSRAGMPEFSPAVFENSRALSSPRLAILGDVFYVPASWPLSNVFSIGDVLIVAGSTYLAHRWCSKPRGRELATVGADGSLDDVDQIDGVDDVETGPASTGAHDLV